MARRLVVVTGTGTEVGKTHLAEALLLAWAARPPPRGRRIAGVKPLESGVLNPDHSDAARLQRASSFPVNPFAYAFREPLSPHLAAARAGVTLDVAAIARGIEAVRADADGVVVELPGGLFSPFAPDLVNAEFARRLRPDAVILVTVDRLGVLHDTGATVRAAHALALPITGIVLMAPPSPDASTGWNAAEVLRFVPAPVLATLPRLPPPELAALPQLQLTLDRSIY